MSGQPREPAAGPDGAGQPPFSANGARHVREVPPRHPGEASAFPGRFWTERLEALKRHLDSTDETARDDTTRQAEDPR
jgi:hypothetical protein